MELGGRPTAVDALVTGVGAGFHAILRRLAQARWRASGAARRPWRTGRWRGWGSIRAWSVTSSPCPPKPSPAVDAPRLFPEYVHTVEALLHAIDQWPVVLTLVALLLAGRRSRRPSRRRPSSPRRSTTSPASSTAEQDAARAADPQPAGRERRRASSWPRCETFQPYADLQSYAVKMFENHGTRHRRRAARTTARSIVLAVDDRQVRIEVGYGLEGFVTDGFAGETSRDVMVPFFRRGEYGQGLLAGATRVAQRIARGAQRHAQRAGAARATAPAIGRRADQPAHHRSSCSTSSIACCGGGRRRSAWPRRRGRWTSGVGPFGVGAGWGSSGSWGGSAAAGSAADLAAGSAGSAVGAPVAAVAAPRGSGRVIERNVCRS